MSELNSSQLAELTALIKSQLLELTEQIDSLHEQAEPVVLDQQSIGRVSRIDAIGQQQMAKASERKAIVLIKQLQTALLRVADDDYGWCETCGESIGYGRLSVQPAAIYCIKCQQLSEN